MKSTYIYLFFFLLISCSSNSKKSKVVVNQSEIDEVVDIRIFENGEVKINNGIVKESALPSAISALNTSKETRARIIINKKTYTELVNKTLRLLHKEGVTRFYSKSLTPIDFEEYNQDNIHIDILSSGRILLNGIKLFPKDLNIALNSPEFDKDDKIILSFSKGVTVGPAFDTQIALAKNGFMKFQSAELSEL